MTEPISAEKKKRKRMGVSPTARSLAWLRSHPGWIAAVVEQTLPRCFIKRDLFGLADIACIDDEPGVLFVQATTETHLGDHVAKAEAQAALVRLLGTGNRFEIHVYGKRVMVPRPGVKRTRAGAFEYVMRRVSARLDGGAVTWHELQEPPAR